MPPSSRPRPLLTEDERALAALVVAWVLPILRAHGLHGADQEDVAQESLLALARAWPLFLVECGGVVGGEGRPAPGPRAWAIVRNKAVDWRRETGRERARVARALEAGGVPLMGYLPDGAGVIEAEDYLEATLAQLPAHLARVVRDRLAGMKQKEIAAMERERKDAAGGKGNFATSTRGVRGYLTQASEILGIPDDATDERDEKDDDEKSSVLLLAFFGLHDELPPVPAAVQERILRNVEARLRAQPDAPPSAPRSRPAPSSRPWLVAALGPVAALVVGALGWLLILGPVLPGCDLYAPVAHVPGVPLVGLAPAGRAAAPLPVEAAHADAGPDANVNRYPGSSSGKADRQAVTDDRDRDLYKRAAQAFADDDLPGALSLLLAARRYPNGAHAEDRKQLLARVCARMLDPDLHSLVLGGATASLPKR